MDDGPVAPESDAQDATRRAALIHREILQIGVLIVIAVAGFFLTRAVAASNRDATLRDAETWYAQGLAQLHAGRLDGAVDSLRRASVRNRYERRYALALARALAQTGDTDAARSALLTLRDAAPEDPEVNLELARLAARRGDVTEAVRFYHNALYAPWPSESEDARRRVRLEMIELLLAQQQTGRALAELVAMTGDLPDDPGIHVRIGGLLARAGDPRHAFEQYERALRLAPGDGAALAGAGTSAFALGHVAAARAYLHRAPAELDGVARTRELADLVMSNDPLARSLGAGERRRRLIANLDYLQQRLSGCFANGTAPAFEIDDAALRREADAFHHELDGRRPLDQDTIEAGVDLFDRIERRLAGTCATSSSRDDALRLIVRLHASEAR